MPEPEVKQKPVTRSRGVLSSIISGLSKSFAGSARVLYAVVPQPEHKPEHEGPKGSRPSQCSMLNALSRDFPGRNRMLYDDSNKPGINISAAIKLDTRFLTTYRTYSKDVEAVKSPCLYMVSNFLKTFNYEYNCVKTSTETSEKHNVVSICIAKQVYEAVTTANSHRHTLSGSTLVPNTPSTSPTSPKFPVEGAPTIKGNDAEENYAQHISRTEPFELQELPEQYKTPEEPNKGVRLFNHQPCSQCARLKRENEELKRKDNETRKALDEMMKETLVLQSKIRELSDNWQPTINLRLSDADKPRPEVGDQCNSKGRAADGKNEEIASDEVANTAPVSASEVRLQGAEKVASPLGDVEEKPEAALQYPPNADMANPQPLILNDTACSQKGERPAQAPITITNLSSLDLLEATTKEISTDPTRHLPLPQPQLLGERATNVQKAENNQKDGSTTQKTGSGPSFKTYQNDNIEAPLPKDAAALSLNIDAFANTSRAGIFNTPPLEQKPIPKDPQPVQEGPRTKFGKTRAQVVMEVAVALALRKVREQEEAAASELEDRNAEAGTDVREKEARATDLWKTETERCRVAVEARIEALEMEQSAAKKKKSRFSKRQRRR